jgi:hypothetical protein
VLFRFREGNVGEPVSNNYIVTAYLIKKWWRHEKAKF